VYFIAKDSNTSIPLTLGEQSVLMNVEKHNYDEVSAFAKKLSQLKNKFWIKCNCNQKALLIICNLHGKIYIRCKSRTLHNIGCTFIQKNIVLHLQNLAPITIRPTKLFALYKTSVDISNTRLNIIKPKSAGNSCLRLGQILFTILNDAKVNVLNPGAFISVIEQLTNVTRSFQDEGKLIAKNIILGSCYRYLLSEETLVKAEDFLQKAQYWFPSNLTPFVIFTSLATKITANSFTAKRDNKTYRVENKISTTSPWINLDKSAPYFLAVSAILDSNNNICLKDCFALPIFNLQTLIPLESNYERTILKIVLSICRNYSNISITKPLFDLVTKDKKKYRPDFIITLNNHKIFIEVLGSSNTDYLVHKHYISQIAKNECSSYISVKAYELQDHYYDFVNSLKAALKQISKKSRK
jgi:hypothetical protein